jgi:ATP-dependent Clp protease ATP-binding subunit ClpA
MPHSLTLPFHAVRLHLANGDVMTVPLNDTQVFHPDKSAADLAKRYASRLQKNQLDRGKYLPVLNMLTAGAFSNKTFLVNFPAAKDGISYPAFALEFDYFYQINEKGTWGVLPALSLESSALDLQTLEKNLEEAVRAEFSVRKRLVAVQQILSAAWFDEPEIEQAVISLQFYSPKELEELQKEKKQELLPKVAEKLSLKKPVAYGREEELAYMQRILKNRFQRNILLVGASGTGKTALVWETVYRSAKAGIEGHFWETTASLLIKELTLETGWQDNLNFLVKELNRRGDILFVRNLAELFEVGQYEGNAISMAEYLRPFLSRGEITLISECTPEERARIDARSPGYLSMFQTVQLQEPKGDLESIIARKVADIAGERKITIEPEAIREIIRLHRRFSPYSGMPGKPIRFLESLAIGLSDKKDPDAETALTPQTVIRHYCEETGMPPFMVDDDLFMDVAAIKSRFNAAIFGQKEAVDAVVDMLASVKTALTRTGKPIASFLFVGPTGVGKTELAKVLAEFMFGKRDRLLRFDMSEFSDNLAVQRLIGTGYGSDDLLTSAVRREPFCVLLFDEIEKADLSFFDLLLQILGEGRLTDGRGKLVNFCSTIIIMTSNEGAGSLQSGQIGLKKGQSATSTKDHFIRAVEKAFRPELFNRLDSVIPFDQLSKENVRYVVERELALLKKREGLAFRRLDLYIDDRVLDFLTEKGYETRYGARYLQRTLRELLVVPLSQRLNEFNFDDRLLVNINLDEEAILIHIESDPLGFHLLMEQWDQLTFAEETSLLRRQVARVFESAFYHRFTGELEQLDDEKKRLGEKFWENRAQSKNYIRMLDARQTSSSLQRQIQEMEEEIALAFLELEPYRIDFQERLEQWKEDFFQHQVAVHNLLYPAAGTCHFAIFGTGLERVVSFYRKIIDKKGFILQSALAIWHSEIPAEAQAATTGTAAAGQPGMKNPSKESNPYVKLECTPEDLAYWKIPKPASEGILCGMELEIRGLGAFLFLLQEQGLHLWQKTQSNGEDAYLIIPKIQAVQVPKTVHRQSFFKNEKPRRQVSNGLITDTIMNFQAPIREKDFPAFLLEKLEFFFRKKIEKIFE